MNSASESSKLCLRFEFRLLFADGYRKGEAVDSPIHTVGHFRCCLRIYPLGRHSDGESRVRVFLKAQPAANWSPQWVFKDVHYEIALHCARQKILESRTHTFHLERDEIAFDDLSEINWEMLYFDHFVNKHELCFRVSLWGDCLGEKPPQVDQAVSISTRLWDDMCFCDATMVPGSSGNEVPCHRAVLACTSKVFERMLKSDFKEGESAKIVLTDACEADVRALLQFMYTGDVPEGADCIKMCRYSDMYDLPELGVICGQRAVHQMQASNVKDVLRALRKRGASEALDAIYKNARSKVNNSPTLFDALVDAE